MSNNPYSAAISRVFGIVTAGLASVLCLIAVGHSLVSGHALGFGRRSALLGNGYTASADPSQFWFGIVFYSLGGLGLGWLAWRTYRS